LALTLGIQNARYGGGKNFKVLRSAVPIQRT